MNGVNFSVLTIIDSETFPTIKDKVDNKIMTLKKGQGE